MIIYMRWGWYYLVLDAGHDISKPLFIQQAGPVMFEPDKMVWIIAEKWPCEQNVAKKKINLKQDESKLFFHDNIN